MNEANYASLEASKRLVAAGIVLETEAGWYKIFRPGSHAFDMVLSARSGNEKFYGDNFPAPSMAEVWRELPECIPYDDTTWAAWQAHKQGDLTIISIAAFRKEFISLNPTDALIDLLIWVRKESENDLFSS